MRFSILKQFALVSIALVAVAAVGCSGKPSGFPSVSSCSITVTDGGSPIEGVEIALVPSEVMSGVVVGGKTDATGVCAVTTTFANFTAPGAPKGEFTVQLKKQPVLEDMPELTPAEMTDMSRSEIDKYYKERDAKLKAAPQIIPPQLTSFQSSPLKVNVPTDSAVTFDVAEYK